MTSSSEVTAESGTVIDANRPAAGRTDPTGRRITTLSEVLPRGQVYFYGFPVGQDSGFLNACPPALEELVAMRPAVCAGPDISVVVFSSTTEAPVLHLLRDVLGVPLAPAERLLTLPPWLDDGWTGSARDTAICHALQTLTAPGQLLMAQPYPDEALAPRLAIPPRLTIDLNRKDTLTALLPEAFQIPTRAYLDHGAALAALDPRSLPLPCVVKVCHSSAGDGVFICRSLEALERAQQRLAGWPAPILVQDLISKVDELDVKFAVFPDPVRPPALLGASHEQTGPGGHYLGGIIPATSSPLEAVIFEVLQATVLPALQARGWYGVGGVDVLIDASGAFYFSDFNCRMTACMAQTFQKNAGLAADRSLLVFNGRVEGSLETFQRRLAPLARHGHPGQLLNVVALASSRGSLGVHGGVLFDQPETLQDNIRTLERLGVTSPLFGALGGG